MDISASLVGSGEPAAQQIAVWKFHHGGSVSGGITACGKQSLAGSHLFVFVNGSIPVSPGSFGYVIMFSSNM